MKLLKFLLVFCSSLQFSYAQSNFEFVRSWGTYLGPIGGNTGPFLYKNDNIKTDNANNIYMTGDVANYGYYFTPTYFTNFVMGSSSLPFVNHNNLTNGFQATFDHAGTQLSYEFNGRVRTTPGLYARTLGAIDSNDNKYYLYLEVNANNAPVPITPNTAWSTLPPNQPVKLILGKYNTQNQLQWATYLPTLGNINNFASITVDQDGNIYVAGETNNAFNIGTTGTYAPSYITMYDNYNNLLSNGYIVKLNPSGEQIWGTHLPVGAQELNLINNQLIGYMNVRTNNSPISYITPGCFQSTKADYAIISINSNNGSLNWGTYYGPTTQTDNFLLRDMRVNESGIYIAGDDFSPQNYFGTLGTFKHTKTSIRELFLSKFDLQGQREWSSYFGGTGSGYTHCSQTEALALIGDEAFVCGNLQGDVSNIATPGAFQTSPEYTSSTSNNFFFAKFSENGQLSWASYYGGTNNDAIPMPYWDHKNINISAHNNTLYLYGGTNSEVGFASNDAWMTSPNLPTGSPFSTISFLAKFDLKTLSVHENTLSNIKLFNNPNNGNFTIRGQILGKGKNTVSIYDASGRLIHFENFSNTTKKAFNLQSKLNSGQYTLELKQNHQPLKTFKIVVKK